MVKRMNDTEERKRQILTEATRLFTQKGYHGVGIDEIAEACGIVRGTVLRYFGSKEELYKQVLFSNGNASADYLVQIAEDESMSVIEALHTLIELAAQQFDVVKDFAADYLEDPLTKHNFDVIRLPVYNNLEKYLEKILIHGNSQGIFHISNPKIRAYSIIFAVFGISGSLESTEEMLREMYEVVEKLLGVSIQAENQ